MFKLTVKNRKTQKEKTYQLKKNIIVVGRAQTCDVILESDTVSRQHLNIHLTKEQIFVEDLESGNGTFVGNKLIPPKQKIPLKPDDALRVEDFDLEWQSDVALPEFQIDSPLDSTDPDILEMKMIKKVIGAMSSSKKPQIIFTSEPFRNQTLLLDDPEKTYTIGREPDCDLSIDSSVMSRKQAQIFNKWGTLVIKDLQSKNGTFVNDVPVTGEVSLKDQDQITFGTLKAVFHFPETFNFSEIESSLVKDKEEKAKKKLEDSQSIKLKASDLSASADAQAKSEKTKTANADTPVISVQNASAQSQQNTEKNETENAAPQTKIKKTSVLPKWLSHFSTLEWFLFGFAATVIVAILYALLNLLQS